MDVIDAGTLEALRDLQEEGDDDLLGELIDLFLQDAPERLIGIQVAVEASDWGAVAERAHSLKGSCGSLGALHMAALCARLEAMGRGLEARTDAAMVCADLQRQYALVEEALRRERNATH